MKRPKKIFRWTIFKKTFVLMLMGFMLINIVNVYLDFYYTRNRVMDTMSDCVNSAELLNLSSDFSENYRQLDNKEFLKRFNTFDDDYYYYSINQISSGRIEALLLDKNYHIINPKKMEYYSSFYNENDEGIINVSFHDYNIDHDILLKVEKTIMKYTDQDKEILLKYSINQKNKITYLAIDNLVIIHESQTYTQTSALLNYYSENMSYNAEFLDSDPYSCYFLYKEVRNSIVDHVKTEKDDFIIYNEDGNTQQLYGYGNSFQSGDDIYYYQLVPLLNNGVPYFLSEPYDENDIEGYIVVYACNSNAILKITDEVIQSKWLVYISSFVVTLFVCYVISYMFSKRIKRINIKTKQIANNDFDIELNEKSRDELGDLACHINKMSQQLKQTIDCLNEEIERVKKLESVRQEFITNFTHEIKTPLGIINGYIELIEETTDEIKKEQYLQAIEKETEKINELVLAMLNLSRLESGKVELNLEDVHLDDIVASTIDSMISLMNKKEIQVIVNGEDTVIQVDIFEFQMVVKNFLSNAIKHTPQKGHIYITYHSNELSIENEGSTLTSQQMESIWDTYVSSDRGGTGLGLAICKSILDLHGFKYKIRNTDRGVCFTIGIRR